MFELWNPRPATTGYHEPSCKIVPRYRGLSAASVDGAGLIPGADAMDWLEHQPINHQDDPAVLLEKAAVL